jgi:hypothetical protein
VGVATIAPSPEKCEIFCPSPLSVTSMTFVTPAMTTSLSAKSLYMTLPSRMSSISSIIRRLMT